MRDLTGGAGAEAVIDFVGEGDAVAAAFGMVRARGTYFVVGYGGELRVPTFAVVLPEISIVGNAVGTYDDLRELMALAATRAVQVHTRTLPPRRVRRRDGRPRTGPHARPGRARARTGRIP